MDSLVFIQCRHILTSSCHACFCWKTLKNVEYFKSFYRVDRGKYFYLYPAPVGGKVLNSWTFGEGFLGAWSIYEKLYFFHWLLSKKFKETLICISKRYQLWEFEIATVNNEEKVGISKGLHFVIWVGKEFW